MYCSIIRWHLKHLNEVNQALICLVSVGRGMSSDDDWPPPKPLPPPHKCLLDVMHIHLKRMDLIVGERVSPFIRNTNLDLDLDLNHNFGLDHYFGIDIDIDIHDIDIEYDIQY